MLSILGCGWLGLPLGNHFSKKKWIVNGSTTSKDKLSILEENGITPFLLKIENNTIDGDLDSFLKTSVLIIDVPFGKQKDNFQGYEKLVKKIESSSVEKVIFISSTSVYADTNSEVFEDENFEVNPAKQILVDLENLFLTNTNFKTTVVRFSGLVGGTRNPGNFFKPDRIVKNGLAPINLIHRDDCIGIIEKIIEKNSWNTIYNAASDTHPTRKDFYTAASIQKGNKPATFLENEKFSYKIISNKKLKTDLEYTFQHPDVLEMLAVF